MHTISMQPATAKSNSKLPTFTMQNYYGWRKYYQSLKFLNTAANLIAEKRLIAECTFHIFDRDGNAIGISDGPVYYPTELSEMKHIADIVVAIEDHRFFSHHGIDFKAIARALIHNIKSLRVVEGGSTITQQLVRNSLITPERSLLRKILEVLLALKIESCYSKKEILNLYLQFVYLGNGIRGFSAASKVIYRRSLRSLTYEQSCGLVGLIRRPSSTYPGNDKKRFINRQTFIDSVMQQKKPSGLKSRINISSTLNPVEINKFKKPRWSGVIDNLLESGCLGAPRRDIKRVGITVDSQVQLILDDVLRQVSFEENTHQVAAVVLDNTTCDVLGESSWSNGKELNFSPTFHGKIQPGSTFKTFAFLTALEYGLPSGQKLSSSPFASEFIKNDDGAPWTVRNYSETYRGEITLSHALKCSDNTVYARLAELLDVEQLSRTLSKFHLCSDDAITPSIVLGASTSGISLLDLVAAYAAIARNGNYVQPRFIKYVEDYHDLLYWANTRTQGSTVSDNAWAIAQVKTVLQEVGELAGFTGFSGKTGTTKKGSIFVGYNEKISVAIWMGFKESPEEGDPKAITSQRTLSKIIETALGYKSKLFSI